MKVDIFLSYHKIILPSVLVFSFLYSTFTVPSYLAKKLSGSLVGCSKKSWERFHSNEMEYGLDYFFNLKMCIKKMHYLCCRQKGTHIASQSMTTNEGKLFEWNTYCTIGHVSERAVWFFFIHIQLHATTQDAWIFFYFPWWWRAVVVSVHLAHTTLHLLQLWKWFLGETIGE